MSINITEQDDAGLLREYARTRDSRLFELFTQRHVDWIYAMALRMTKEPAMAEDVTQGVLLAVSQKAQTVAKHPAIASWLFRATRYGASVLMRAERRRKRYEEAAVPQAATAPPHGSDIAWLDVQELLDGAVAKLSAADREAILLRFYRQLTHGEIAAMLRIPEETARKRVNRALARLRGLMGVKGTEASLGTVLTSALKVAAPKHVAAASAGPRALVAAKGIHSALAIATLKVAAALIIAAIVPIAVATTVIARRPARRESVASVAAPAALSAKDAVATPPADNQITGDVVDADGKPVEGAEVDVTTRSPRGQELIVASTHTGPDGKFSLHNDANAATFYAFIPGIGISESPPPDSKPLHLKLLPSADILLTLIAPDGKPAEGVVVRPRLIVFRNDAEPIGSFVFLPDEASKTFAGTTDSSGKCIVHGLPRDARVRFDTDDPRYAHLGSPPYGVIEGATGEVALQPIHLLKAATIAGRLINPETNQPVEGLEVDAQAFNSDHDGGGGSGITNTQGEFTLDRMPPGNYVVSLGQPEGKQYDWAAAAIDVKLAEGDHAVANLVLTRGGFLKGQVRDAVTGTPISGVMIGLYGSSKPRYAGSIYGRTSDANGRFEFRVAPGEQYPYLSSIPPDGYLQPAGQGMQNISVAEGQTVEVNFNLQPDPTPAIEGTVTDPDGNPVAGATVMCEDPQEMMSGRPPVKTDAQGGFHLHAHPGALLRARWKEMGTITPTKVTGDSPLELQLQPNPTFTLIVHLTDPTGQPIPNAAANLIIETGRFGMGGQPHKADAQGIVRFESLAADGKYSLEAEAPDYGISQAKVRRPPFNEPRELNVNIVLHKATAEIAGTVVDENGKPLPNIQVGINGGETGAKTTRTDAHGHFSFHVVNDASALIWIATEKGDNFKPRQATAGETDLKLVFPKSPTPSRPNK